MSLWRDECGASALEYGLIAALIAVSIMGNLKWLGQSLAIPLAALSGLLRQANV